VVIARAVIGWQVRERHMSFIDAFSQKRIHLRIVCNNARPGDLDLATKIASEIRGASDRAFATLIIAFAHADAGHPERCLEIIQNIDQSLRPRSHVGVLCGLAGA
jgi:hypothetical protein